MHLPEYSKKWFLGVMAALLLIVFSVMMFRSNCDEQREQVVQKRIAEACKPIKQVTVKGCTFDMVLVKGGTFTMGATPEQGTDAGRDENPAHQVTLSDYYIGKTEVTQALWYAVMGQKPTTDRNYQWTSNYGLGDNYPAYRISYNDCKEFIAKLNRLTGLKFTIPTEAQWEYAARGGNKSKGYKYSGSNTIDNVAWYWENSKEKPNYETHKVATKSRNELGLYDMSGNVYEWCYDWYASYSSNSVTNPIGSSTGTYRVIRGGCWYSDATYSRVVSRGSYLPDYRNAYIGLRLAIAIE